MIHKVQYIQYLKINICYVHVKKADSVRVRAWFCPVTTVVVVCSKTSANVDVVSSENENRNTQEPRIHLSISKSNIFGL
jgi:hypothetical protein